MQELVRSCEGVGLPWIVMGDRNLEQGECGVLLQGGVAHCMDEPCETSSPLPATAGGTAELILQFRRATFGQLNCFIGLARPTMSWWATACP